MDITHKEDHSACRFQTEMATKGQKLQTAVLIYCSQDLGLCSFMFYFF